jgi:hypothetical protein
MPVVAMLFRGGAVRLDYGWIIWRAAPGRTYP